MTTGIPLILQTSQRVSYPRSRLLLGITGVGTAVLFATALLATDLASDFLSRSPDQPLPQVVGSLALAFAVIILLFLLFDIIGGALLVRQRAHDWRMLGRWFGRWLRGATVQWCFWMGSAAALMAASRAAGPRSLAAAVAVFTLLQLVLAARRSDFARLVAHLPTRPTPAAVQSAACQAGIDQRQLTMVEVMDEGFVGGYGGIRATSHIMPLRFSRLSAPALLATLVRRRILAESGAHTRGVLGAALWNSTGLLMVLLGTGASFATASGVLTIMAGMTLWAFCSVLLLPSVSRAAVHALDAQAASECGSAAVRAAIEELDRWQDDEPTRSRLVETVFHPVPARADRLARLQHLSPTSRSVRFWHAHHVARHALWLSWAAMTPLSRLVHCNVGRPALWVMLPSD